MFQKSFSILPFGKLVLVAVFNFFTIQIARAAEPPPVSEWTSTILPRDSVPFPPTVATSPDEAYHIGWLWNSRRPVASLKDAAGHRFTIWQEQLTAADFSPDNSTLAIGTRTGAIQIVEMKNLRRAPDRKIEIKKPNPDTGGIRALVFSPSRDEMSLVFADGGEAIILLDAVTGKQRGELKHGVRGNNTAMLIGRNGSLLVGVGSEVRKTDFTLKKWDAKQKLPARMVAMALSEDKRILAVATTDLSVTIFDAESLKPLQTVREEGKALADNPLNSIELFSIAVSAKGDRVFTATEQSNGRVTVWDVRSGKKTGSFTHPRPKWVPENQSVRILAGLNGKVKTFWVGTICHAMLWDPPEGVDLLPPPDLYLVRGKAVKVDGFTSQWEVLQVFTGSPDLKGKTFIAETAPGWGNIMSNNRYKNWIHVNAEGIWWIKWNKREGGLAAEVDDKRLSEFDRGSIFQSLSLAGEQEKCAEAYRKLAEAASDSERVKILAKYADSSSTKVSEWAIDTLRKSKREEAQKALKALGKEEK